MLEITAAAIKVALSFIQLNVTGMASVWQMLSRFLWKHSGKEREVHDMQYSHCLILDTNNMKQNHRFLNGKKEASPEGDLKAQKLGLLF